MRYTYTYFKVITFTILYIMYHSSLRLSGKNRREVHEQLCVSLSHTQVGAVLKGVTSEVDCKQFYTFYLHDFVKSVYKSKYKGDLQNKEHKVSHTEYSMTHAICLTNFASTSVHS